MRHSPPKAHQWSCDAEGICTGVGAACAVSSKARASQEVKPFTVSGVGGIRNGTLSSVVRSPTWRQLTDRSWGAASRTIGQHSRSELWIWEGDVDAFRVLTGGSFLGWQRSHQSLVGQSWLMSLWHEVHVGLADVWKVKLGWAWRPTQVFCEVKGMEEGEQPMCSGWMRFEYARVTWRMGFVPDQRRGCSTQGERWQGHGREVATKTHGLPKAVMHLLWSLRSHFVHSLWIKKKKTTGNSVICFKCFWESQN